MRRWMMSFLLVAVLSLPALAATAPTGRLATPVEASQVEPAIDRKNTLVGKIASLHAETILLFEQEDYVKARQRLLELLEIAPDDSVGWYNLACAHSRLGELDEAMQALERSLELGLVDFPHMLRDPDLERLREAEAFGALLGRRREIHRRRAQQAYEELREQFGEGYIFHVDHDSRLVIATNTDRAMLDEMTQYLVAYAEAQRGLFGGRPEHYITVVIPRPEDFTAQHLGGYYAHARRLVVARTLGSSLTHEFTHALHSADQDARGQEHPIWVVEGLATLFETSILQDGRAVPSPVRGWRCSRRSFGSGGRSP